MPLGTLAMAEAPAAAPAAAEAVATAAAEEPPPFDEEPTPAAAEAAEAVPVAEAVPAAAAAAAAGAPTKAAGGLCGWRRSAAELLREAAAEADKLASFYRPIDAADEEADLAGAGASQRKCRPLSLDDYYRRLRAFQPGWWFAKPVGVSPIECARRGWAGAGRDLVACECCGAELAVQREGHIWLVNGKPVEGQPGEAALLDGHSPFCPWRCHDVALTDPAKMSEREIEEATDRRLERLRSSLEHVPVLSDGEAAEAEGREADACEALTRAGWEYAGLGGSAPQRLELLRCFFCLRTVSVQSFSHCLAPKEPARSEDGEPMAKARRVEAKPPQDGLWTPRSGFPTQGGSAGEGDGASSAEGASSSKSSIVAMDPHALHRFYCPMYSRAEEDLSPLAARVIEARAEGAERRRRWGARQATATQEAVASASSAEAEADAAVARAKELLAGLYAILPPAST